MEVLSFRQLRHPVPFLILLRKIEHFRKKVAKSFAVSRILLTFAVRVGVDGKERLR